MKKVLFLMIFIFSCSVVSAAEEQVKVDQPEDPITAILTAPFQILGAIFSGDGVVYDPDAGIPYGRVEPYGDWYYWDDPYYYYGRYYRDRYYGHHFYCYRHHRYGCRFCW